MYSGEVHQLEFKYYGASIEAVLDKLPMAIVTHQEESAEGKEVHTVKAQVFGHGIIMWLLNQGSKVEVIRPRLIKEQWIREVQAIINRK